MNLSFLAGRVYRLLGSYGLSCVILLFLLLLTFLGTLEQVNHSLYDVQRKYFESLFVVGDVLPIPLPGAYLLLSILFVNLLVGGMVRLRRDRSRIGIFTIHVGIAMLLLGGMVEYHASNKGHLTLFEGEQGAQFQSYYEWEVAVVEELKGGRREYVVPHGVFAHEGRPPVTVTSPDLPFELELSDFVRNCRPRRGTLIGDETTGVDGVLLQELPLEGAAERNVAGLTARLTHDDGRVEQGLLWGFQYGPWTVTQGERRWHVHLRKRSFELPFRIHLRDFTRELHPGTGMASSFYSDVTAVEGGTSQDLRISMNEPLRRHGFTLYQASWGPGNARPGDRLFSTFAVVQNPADRVPMWACVLIAIGLLVHFLPMLTRHIRRNQSARRPA